MIDKLGKPTVTTPPRGIYKWMFGQVEVKARVDSRTIFGRHLGVKRLMERMYELKTSGVEDCFDQLLKMGPDFYRAVGR